MSHQEGSHNQRFLSRVQQFSHNTWNHLRLHRRMLPAYLKKERQVVYSDITIDWEVVNSRINSTAEIEDASCITTAFILRDHLEEDHQINPQNLWFESACTGETLWHVWLMYDGKIVDSPKFKKEYAIVYFIGVPDAQYEDLYQRLKKLGLAQELRSIDFE